MSFIAKFVLLLTLLFAVASCAPVKPWQKGNLAKRHMAFDTDVLESRYHRHIHKSKEGTHGGYGVGGGGCGCG